MTPTPPPTDLAEAPTATPVADGHVDVSGEDAIRHIDRALARGVAWTSGLKVVGQAAAWASTLLVARLLSADDYGLFGLSLLIVNVAQMVTDFGIGTAIVARTELDRRDFAELNTVSVLFGAAGTLVLCAAAPFVAKLYRQPAVMPVVLALSASIFIGSFRSVPLALLQRELRFRRLAVYDAVQTLLLAAASIAFAAAGWRYWTLVAAALLSVTVSTAITVARHPVAFARPGFERLRAALRYCREVVVTRLAWYGYMNADFVVAGRVLGTTQAGYYGLAWTLSHMVTDRVAQLILQVTPGVLARVQHDRALLRRYFVHMTFLTALVCWPLTIGLAAVATDFVTAILGARWLPLTFPLAVLSAYSSVWGVLGLVGQMLFVTGDERFARQFNLLMLALMTPAFALAAHWGGIRAVALVWVVVHPIVVVATTHRTLVRLALSPADFVRECLLVPAAACGVMAAAVVGVRHVVPADVAPMLRLALGVTTGAAVYVGLFATVFRSTLDRALVVVRGLRGGGGGDASAAAV